MWSRLYVRWGNPSHVTPPTWGPPSSCKQALSEMMFLSVIFLPESPSVDSVESNYVLMGKVLDSVTHHPYLGVELSRNLDWGQHVNNKVMKANLSLGFLRRNLSSCPEEWKRQPTKPLWAASRGIRKLSLGPTLKKTRQTNRGSTKKSRTLR